MHLELSVDSMSSSRTSPIQKRPLSSSGVTKRSPTPSKPSRTSPSSSKPIPPSPSAPVPAPVPAPSSSSSSSAPSSQISIAQTNVSHQEHLYRFTIDLQSISLSPSLPLPCANVYMYYQYPAFGTHAPMRSTPVIVNRGSVGILENGFCAYEFGTEETLLYRVLARTPLVVRVYHRDERARDELLGYAAVPLVQVLEVSARECVCEAVVCAFEESKSSNKENASSSFGADERVRKVGVLSVALKLEDLGVHKKSGVSFPLQSRTDTAAQEPAHAEVESEEEKELESKQGAENSSNVPLRDTTNVVVQPGRNGQQAQQKQGVSSSVSEELMRDTAAQEALRGTPEYRAAFDLEVWRGEQKTLFLMHLQRLEKTRLQELESKFVAFEQQKTQELETLEKMVREKATALEKREAKIVLLESETKRKRTEVDAQTAKMQTECAEKVRRTKEEAEHKMALERLKMNEALKEKKETLSKLEVMTSKYEALLEEFTNLKKQFYTVPQNSLEAKLNESEKKADKYEAKYKKYKEMYLELKNLREGGAVAAVASAPAASFLSGMRTPPQTQPIEAVAAHLPVVSQLLHASSRELEEEQKALQSLKEMAASLLRQQSPEAVQPKPVVQPRAEAVPSAPQSIVKSKPSSSPELDRLVRERESLLATGVYTLEDYVIRRLSSQIGALQR